MIVCKSTILVQMNIIHCLKGKILKVHYSAQDQLWLAAVYCVSSRSNYWICIRPGSIQILKLFIFKTNK